MHICIFVPFALMHMMLLLLGTGTVRHS